VRLQLSLVLILAAQPGGVIAQAPRADTLTSAAADSALDAVMLEVAASYALLPRSREGTFLSPYATYRSDSAYRPTPQLPEHDAAWLLRTKTQWGFTAVCADFGPRACPPRNGGVYIALTAPRPSRNGLMVVTVRVYTRWPSSTARYAWEAGEDSFYLTRRDGRWDVFCHGLPMHEQGTGGHTSTGE
jgi:hypothetical protein